MGTAKVCGLSASVRSFIFVMPLFRNKPERVFSASFDNDVVVFAKMQPNPEKCSPTLSASFTVESFACASARALSHSVSCSIALHIYVGFVVVEKMLLLLAFKFL